jgi:hypothetical protein
MILYSRNSLPLGEAESLKIPQHCDLNSKTKMHAETAVLLIVQAESQRAQRHSTHIGFQTITGCDVSAFVACCVVAVSDCGPLFPTLWWSKRSKYADEPHYLETSGTLHPVTRYHIQEKRRPELHSCEGSHEKQSKYSRATNVFLYFTYVKYDGNRLQHQSVENDKIICHEAAYGLTEIFQRFGGKYVCTLNLILFYGTARQWGCKCDDYKT